MRPRSCALPFGLISAGLLFPAFYVVDVDDTGRDRWCRAAGGTTAVVTAVATPAPTPAPAPSRTSGCN